MVTLFKIIHEKKGTKDFHFKSFTRILHTSVRFYSKEITTDIHSEKEIDEHSGHNEINTAWKISHCHGILKGRVAGENFEKPA